MVDTPDLELEPGATPWRDDELDLRALARPDRPWVASNFAMSLDGRIAIDGRARGIGSEVDLAWLHQLRGFADAVLVGAGTLRSEWYGPLLHEAGRDEVVAARVARGQRPHPTCVVVTRTLDLPWDSRLFTSGLGEVLVATVGGGTTPSLPETATPTGVLELPDARRAADGSTSAHPRVDLAALTRRLRLEHDVRSLVCEGGAHVHRDLVRDGALDEAFVTVAPKLVGEAGAPTILAGGTLPAPTPLDLVDLRRSGSELFGRWRVRR